MRYSVDWLSGSNGKVRDEVELAAFANKFNTKRGVRATRPLFGYQWACTDVDGILYQSGEREDMGTHILATGTALTSTMDRFNGYTKLMAMIESIIPARLDLAVDTDTNFADKFAKEVRNGALITRAKAWSIIESQENGRTVYVGSRSSAQFLRVYNKASEQFLSDVNWTRIELESKAKAAIAAKGMIAVNGIADTAKSLIRGFCDCDLSEWKQAFTSEPVYWKSTKGQTQTRKWLLSVCAPCMRKLIEGGDETIFEDFAHKVFPD